MSRGGGRSPSSTRRKRICWRYRADRRIEILQSQTWYFTGDSPDLHKVARGWEAKLADAVGRGHDGLRVARGAAPSAAGASHSMTRSARSRTDGGIVTPIVFADFRLTTSSKDFGCSIGSSAGFTPFRIFSM